MIKRKLLAVLLSFGLVFSNVLFVNASETQRLVDTKVETKKDVYTDLTKEENYTEIVGTDYKTSAKETKDYELVDVKGNKTGKYIDGTIEVVYIYDFVGEIGGPDVDPDFPVTGVESNDVAGYILFSSILMLLAIIIKKRF